MKTRTWILLLTVLALVCAGLSFAVLRPGETALSAEIYSGQSGFSGTEDSEAEDGADQRQGSQQQDPGAGFHILQASVSVLAGDAGQGPGAVGTDLSQYSKKREKLQEKV